VPIALFAPTVHNYRLTSFPPGRPMDWLKTLNYNLVLGVAGVGLVVLGLSSGLRFNEYQITILEVPARVAAIALGFLILLGSAALEYFGRKRSSVEGKRQLPDNRRALDSASFPKTNVRAEDVLITLDDSLAHSFPTISMGARRISIFARTAVNLLSAYQNTMVKLCQDGCTIRLLCADPDSEACGAIYGGSRDLYAHNMQTTEQLLAGLARRVGNRLEPRLTRHAPTFGLIAIEKTNVTESSISVQFYFLHAKTGRDRPILPVRSGDKWYHVFMDEFEALWNESRAWELPTAAGYELKPPKTQ
jgi:hypothetical protein